MKTKCIYLFFLFIIVSFFSKAQVVNEITTSSFIKSISFKAVNHEKNQFPIVQMGEPFILEFDDLAAQEQDYYYIIEYFNYDWTPAVLFKNEYLNGVDNQRIINYANSFGTLQRYTHYALELPNEQTQFKLPGNYMISIYNTNEELMFRRKFLIYDNLATIQGAAYRSRALENFNTHQSIQFTINPTKLQLRNPNTDLQIIILQNSQWDNVKKLTKPQYVVGSELHYKYDIPSQFEGGNEFLHFDSKNSPLVNSGIKSIRLEDIYNVYLFTDKERLNYPYTYNPDINGDFVINTVQGRNPSIEADYNLVFFSLAKQYTLRDEEIYVYGKFSNYELKEEYKLTYNPNFEIYEGVLLLKQGFYNYKYVWKTEKGVEKNRISGSHATTENQYTILVYTRILGNQYDSLISTQNISSFEIER